MRGHPAVRVVTIFGTGIAGLVGGHAIGYALAVPDIQHRTTLLVATGHGYLPSASWLALVVGVAAIVSGIASGRMHRARRPPTLRRTAVSLALLQCTSFITLELVERAISSSPVHLLSLRLLAIGLLAQVVCAALGAILVVGLRRIGASLRSRATIAVLPGRSERVDVVEIFASSRSHRLERARDPPARLSV